MFSISVALKITFALAVPVALISFFLSIKNIHDEVPPEQRDFLDPLPSSLSMLWPMVNVLAFYIGERLSVEYLEKTNVLLRKAGVSYLMSPEQFVGLRVLACVSMAGLVYVCLSMLEAVDWRYVFIGGAIGYMTPRVSVGEKRKEREKQVVKALPTYLDFLTMAVQAGMNMSGAINQALSNGPEGPLRSEFSHMVRDIRAGMSRVGAMKSMAERVDIPAVNTFVVAVLQSERTGGSIAEILRHQADQRRIERFQRAEKLAMQAPVKLIFPLVAFIFPTTFMILGFPILQKVLDVL